MSTHNTTGKTGEALAATYLKEKGYEILHQNWRNSRQEIDIIARHQQLLIFIEVKTISSTAFGAPENFVDYQKEKHLEKASLAYIEEEDYRGEIRFDIISVLFDKHMQAAIQHIEDAFFPY